MKWSLLLTSLFVCAALATTEEPETTTSRLHRSTFQEQLQWTTPLPSTDSLPTDSESTAEMTQDYGTETESASIAHSEPHDSPTQDEKQQAPDVHDETPPEKVKTSPKAENAPAAELDYGSAATSSSQNEEEKTEEEEEEDARGSEVQVSKAQRATDDELVEDKQNLRGASRMKPQPQQTSSAGESRAAAAAAEDVRPIVSVEVEERRDSLESTTMFPPKGNPALYLKLSTAAQPTVAAAVEKSTIVDEEAEVLTVASVSEMQTTPASTIQAPVGTVKEKSSLETAAVMPVMSTTDVSDQSEVPRKNELPDSGRARTTATFQQPEEAADATVPPSIGNHDSESANSSESHRNPASIRSESKTTRTAQPETTRSFGSTERKLVNLSEPTPLAEVPPEPQLNEVKSSLNASEKEGSSSTEELPALLMMAFKAAPIVEFSYKEGTPKPPSQQNNAIQREPAKPIGEITEDDHVVSNPPSTLDEAKDSEPPQPEGVLEIARKVTKMLEDKYAAEESRLHRRVGNLSLANLPIAIQRATTSSPHHVETPSTVDYDYPSIELMRLRARERNNRDLETEASGTRNQELHPRTSKIMNAAAGTPIKDKMIFIKNVPEGSLTTTTTTTEPSSTAESGPATASPQPSPAPTTTATTVRNSNETELTTNSTSLQTTHSGFPEGTQLKTETTTQRGFDDDYYDEPTEIVEEEDVVSAPERLPQEAPPRQANIEPTKVIEDRPVMALVVQNPPNENSLTRKELKPLDTKDVQVSFILPAVSEPSLVPHKDKEPSSSKEVTEELSTESIKKVSESSYEDRFAKPYPMQRATTSTTERPNPAVADDRLDTAPTANPMTTLAGGESSSETGEYKLACPSREDIHPCSCVTHEDDYDGQIETVATCRGIKHSATLIEALRGFRGHHLTYLIIDSSDLPPFPNNILHRIQVDWMEVLNTPVQFKREYLQCSIKCTLS